MTASVTAPHRMATPLGIPDTAAHRFLPEGPIPLDHHGRLSWVGIQHGGDSKVGSINRLDLAARRNESFDLPGRPGFAFPCGDDGVFVAGVERSLGFFDVRDRSWRVFCEGIDADVTNTIINDGLVVGDNLIFGTKDLEFATKKAGLYLFRGRDEKLIRLRSDQICSNGKATRTAADGSLRLIDIDSPTKKIVEYPLDLDAGTIGDPITLIDLTDDPGVPDGAILTPDLNGVLVSIFLPGAAAFGQTRWYELATGQLKCVWRTAGSPQNTCPALIEHAGAVHLVITTAVENMTAADQAKCPAAGQIFLGETDFSGPIALPRLPETALDWKLP